MKIRWKSASIMGMFHNNPDGIKTGEIVDLDDHHAKRYIEHELAVPVDDQGAHF